MVPGIDIMFNGFAILSTIIATLRAGSRILYISKHRAIGVMDGPMILPPSLLVQSTTNATSNHDIDMDIDISRTSRNMALFELSENFKHCVRLSSYPTLYQNVQYHVPVTTENERWNQRDPFEHRTYTLGNSPYQPARFRSAASTTLSQEEEEQVEEENEEASSMGSKLDDVVKQELESYPNRNSFKDDKRRGIVWRYAFWRGKQHGRRIEEAAAPIPTNWDYGDVLEADFFYNTSTLLSPPSGGISKEDTDVHGRRRRLAQLTVCCPKVFENLRSIFGVSEEQYLQSILASGPLVSFHSNSKGAARAGGLFFFTRDGAYMIKTIKHEEARTLLRILPNYHRHMKRYGRTSLLTRFCGMYQINMEQEEEEGNPVLPRNGVVEWDDSCLAPTHKVHTFVVMNAVFPAEANTFISERFDLKGSTVGREVSQSELQTKGTNAVMKDLDLAREVELVRTKNRGKGYGLTIGPSAKAALLSQLREDVKVLIDCQVMDVRFFFLPT
jgi:hypothetical protein